MPDLTLDTLLEAAREMQSRVALIPSVSYRIVFAVHVTEATEERLFPASKNRSKRILKKLIKRHGGEFRRRPAMYRVGNTIYAHPAFRSQLEAVTIKETSHARAHVGCQNPIFR